MLNLLGEREPDVHGRETMEDITTRLREAAAREGASLEVFQSNSEGATTARLHAARHEAAAVVLNAGALAHYSFALRDAIAAIRIPVVSVHMSNTAARGGFRRRDVLAPVCAGVITGFGADSFLLGLRAAIDLVRS